MLKRDCIATVCRGVGSCRTVPYRAGLTTLGPRSGTRCPVSRRYDRTQYSTRRDRTVRSENSRRRVFYTSSRVRRRRRRRRRYARRRHKLSAPERASARARGADPASARPGKVFFFVFREIFFSSPFVWSAATRRRERASVRVGRQSLMRVGGRKGGPAMHSLIHPCHIIPEQASQVDHRPTRIPVRRVRHRTTGTRSQRQEERERKSQREARESARVT